MTIALSRADRRRMKRLSDANDPTIEADRRFFVRRPDRQYRIRRMSRAELAQLELASRAPLVPLAPGSAAFTVVKQLAPGVRLRAFVPGPMDEDGDGAGDDVGAVLWARYLAACPAAAEREAAMRAALFEPSGPLHDGGGR